MAADRRLTMLQGKIISIGGIVEMDTLIQVMVPFYQASESRLSFAIPHFRISPTGRR
jgi:hypothetical protein